MSRNRGNRKTFRLPDILLMVFAGLAGFIALIVGIIMIWLPSIA